MRRPVQVHSLEELLSKLEPEPGSPPPEGDYGPKGLRSSTFSAWSLEGTVTAVWEWNPRPYVRRTSHVGSWGDGEPVPVRAIAAEVRHLKDMLVVDEVMTS